MLCCLTLTRMAQFRTTLARGVVLLSRLGLVSIWYSAERETVLLTVPWWKPPRSPQRGQSSIEFVLSIALSGVIVLVIWFTYQLVLTELLHESLIQFAGSY